MGELFTPRPQRRTIPRLGRGASREPAVGKGYFRFILVARKTVAFLVEVVTVHIRSGESFVDPLLEGMKWHRESRLDDLAYSVAAAERKQKTTFLQNVSFPKQQGTRALRKQTVSLSPQQ